MVNLGILDKFAILMDSKDDKIRKEIYWGVSNILASSKEIIEFTINQEIFQKMLKNFQFEDYRVLILLFTRIENFFSFFIF